MKRLSSRPKSECACFLNIHQQEQIINRSLTLKLDHVHSSKLLGETIRMSSFCRELRDARVTSSTSIFVPLGCYGPISNHPSMTIIITRWRRRTHSCCTHRGGRSARRLIAWIAIEKWITLCISCVDSPMMVASSQTEALSW